MTLLRCAQAVARRLSISTSDPMVLEGAKYIAAPTAAPPSGWRDLDTALATGGGPPAEPKPLGGAMGKVHAIGVAAGDAHVLMIGRGGEVVAMGDNSRGQLGVGDPMKIPKCEMPNLLEKLPSPAVRAACGGAHSWF